MALHPNAGKLAKQADLVNVPKLMSAYYLNEPDVEQFPEHRVAFGTSGHRGCSFNTQFNESHILAITQAICDYRKKENIFGPLFLGKDTHALSESAFNSAIEVLVANEVQIITQQDDDFTPTPVISHAVVSHNKAHPHELADGIVVTPYIIHLKMVVLNIIHLMVGPLIPMPQNGLKIERISYSLKIWWKWSFSPLLRPCARVLSNTWT